MHVMTVEVWHLSIDIVLSLLCQFYEHKIISFEEDYQRY